MVTHVALVPYQVNISTDTLTSVAAALQRQVTTHFGPLWDVEATISAFTDWNSVPNDYWRIAIVDELDSGAPGVHRDRNGKPYALVAAHGEWSVVASHECLEMLADPSGARTTSGPSPRDNGETVNFLIEVCDPVGGVQSSYAIDGVQVSNFCTPRYYDGSGAPSEQWVFRGQLNGPRQLLKGGYLAWQNPITQDWWRRDWFGQSLTDNNLGPIAPSSSFLRGEIDARVRSARAGVRAKGTPRKRLSVKRDPGAVAASRALAHDLRRVLEKHSASKPARKKKNT